MELNDYNQIICPKCKALLFAEKRLDHWFCGHCGEKLDVEKEQEKAKPKKAVPVLTGDIFLCNKETLVKYTGNDEDVDIPDYVTKIDACAFKDNKNLRTVHIPDSVLEIGESAFEGCSSLTNVRLSANIRKITYKTFNDCTHLRTITIPASVDEIVYNAMCCGLEEIVFENSYTTWEPLNDYTNPSFVISRKPAEAGVKRIFFKGVAYDSNDIYRFKSVSNYLRHMGLCPACSGKFNVFGKCKSCGYKKD